MTSPDGSSPQRRARLPSSLVQALAIGARRRTLLTEEDLRRLALHAIRRGVRTITEAIAWLGTSGDVTPRLAASLMALMPEGEGTALGEYRLLTHLADGGMGRVHLAADPADRLVVIKTLRPDYDSDQRFAYRFAREAEITAKLDHVNLVRSLGHGSTPNGGLWLALEYVAGGDLEGLVGSGTQVPESEALMIICQLARALEYTERLSLVHRDIKPSNVLFTLDGSVKLSDFGLARSTVQDYSLQTANGMAMGSPRFMSPEQVATRKDLDIRSDLYSLGCLLYYILAGQAPFEDQVITEVMRMHLIAPVPDIREIRPQISERTAKTILKLMSKDRDQRYANAGRLIESLEKTMRLLGSEPDRALNEQTIDLTLHQPPPAFDHSAVAPLTDSPGLGLEDTQNVVGGSIGDSIAVQATLADAAPVAAPPTDLASGLTARWLAVRAVGSYPMTLVLMAQTQAVMGKLRESPIDLSLRVYPTDLFSTECQRISRSHCRLWTTIAGATFLEDTGSANGTLLDGRLLNPLEPRQLEEDREHRLEVPRALRLSLRALPQRTRREEPARGQPAPIGLDSTHQNDAVVIRRLDNRPSLAYALLLRRITIGGSAADVVYPNWCGHDLEIGLLGGHWVWRILGDLRWSPLRAQQELGASGLLCAPADYDTYR